MPVIVRAGVLLLLLTVTVKAYTWSGAVHQAIGEQVYQQLNQQERRYYVDLARVLDLNYVNALSPWVDTVRNEPIATVFDGDVPDALVRLKYRHSSDWHYENYSYFKTEHAATCRLKNKGQLEDALTAINQALKHTVNARQEAILIAFAMHLIEDLHQPLHSNTLIRDDCSHDRGATHFCLFYRAERCVMNLHRLWDGAFGLAKHPDFWSSIHITEALFDRPMNIELSRIIYENRLLIEHVYHVEENRMPHADYMVWAKQQAEGRLRLAVQRVARYLKNHYANKIKSN